MTDGLDIMLCSLECWDDVWRRNQLLVKNILEQRPDSRVLFVEPAVDFLHSVRLRQVPAELGLRRVLPNVWAWRPWKIWPRAIAGLHVDTTLGRRALRAAHQLGMDQPVVWINDTSYAVMAMDTVHPVLYDVTDDWLSASGTARSLRRRRLEHSAMMGRADQVSVVSEPLLRSNNQVRSVTRVPDAVDVDHFQRPQARPEDVPQGDYVAYIGTLHVDRIDVELCVEVARRIAPIPFLLIGPDVLGADARREVLNAGCRLLGPRPYSRIPAYYQHASVIAIPHVVTPFTESLDPIKLYECIAVGTPTVSTSVSGLRDGGPPIEIATGRAFTDRILAALDSHPERIPRDAPTWAQRASEMLRLIDNARHMAQKRAQDTAGRT